MHSSQKYETVDGYLLQFPQSTQDKLQQIREMIKEAAPEATEVISYAIPAYKMPGVGHAFVFFSGYAKHISIYPLPHQASADLTKAIEPHIAGKGTLRFSLSEPLPIPLIKQIIVQLYKEATA